MRDGVFRRILIAVVVVVAAVYLVRTGQRVLAVEARVAALEQAHAGLLPGGDR